jgi:hypothetical protein
MRESRFTGAMETIPKATVIELTQEERTVLEGFVRSAKTEHSLEGLSETGNRGAVPKYTTQPPPTGVGRMFDVLFQVLKYEVFCDGPLVVEKYPLPQKWRPQ